MSSRIFLLHHRTTWFCYACSQIFDFSIFILYLPLFGEGKKKFKILYRNLIHVTCLDHSINRAGECVKEQFPMMKNCPNFSLPPRPIITRYGKWLDAGLFYVDNYDVIKIAIELSNLNHLTNKKLKKHLRFIKIFFCSQYYWDWQAHAFPEINFFHKSVWNEL